MSACDDADPPAGKSPLPKPDGLWSAEAIAFFNPTDESGKAYLAGIGADGSVSAEEVGPLQGGDVMIDGQGRINYADERKSYRVTPPGTTRAWLRGGMQDLEHWSGLRAEAGWVRVFNVGGEDSGAYRTDVIWEDGESTRRAEVADVPGAVGIDGSALWMLGAGDSLEDGTVLLHRVDLTRARTEEPISWKHWHSLGSGLTASLSVVSDLFVRSGTLYFLEEISATNDELEFVDVAPGRRTMLRLGEYSLVNGTYRSTFLTYLENGLRDGAEVPSPVANAAGSGHLSGGFLYTLDSDARLLKISLRSRVLTTVGSIPEAARAGEALAAWSDTELNVLTLAETEAEVLTYRLADARLLRVIRSNDLARFVAAKRLQPSYLAMR